MISADACLVTDLPKWINSTENRPCLGGGFLFSMNIIFCILVLDINIYTIYNIYDERGELMAEVLPVEAIAIIAGELSNGMMAQETNEIIRCLAGKDNDLSQADIQRETGLSYTICREALLLLLGATFISRNRKGYQLSMTGRALVEIIKNRR
jgi:hypothetical protein